MRIFRRRCDKMEILQAFSRLKDLNVLWKMSYEKKYFRYNAHLSTQILEKDKRNARRHVNVIIYPNGKTCSALSREKKTLVPPWTDDSNIRSAKNFHFVYCITIEQDIYAIIQQTPVLCVNVCDWRHLKAKEWENKKWRRERKSATANSTLLWWNQIVEQHSVYTHILV